MSAAARRSLRGHTDTVPLRQVFREVLDELGIRWPDAPTDHRTLTARGNSQNRREVAHVG